MVHWGRWADTENSTDDSKSYRPSGAFINGLQMRYVIGLHRKNPFLLENQGTFMNITEESSEQRWLVHPLLENLKNIS